MAHRFDTIQMYFIRLNFISDTVQFYVVLQFTNNQRKVIGYYQKVAKYSPVIPKCSQLKSIATKSDQVKFSANKN